MSMFREANGAFDTAPVSTPRASVDDGNLQVSITDISLRKHRSGR